MDIRGKIAPRYPVLIALIAILVGFGILAAAPGSHAQNGSKPSTPAESTPAKKSDLPDGEGKAIVQKSCQTCHMLAFVTDSAENADDWRQTVETMIEHGADIPDDQVNILVKYLAKNFGTEHPAPDANSEKLSSPSDASEKVAASAAPPPPEVKLPDGDGKEIATASCNSCHDLTNLTKAHKSLDDWHDTVQLMMYRGADVPPDKVTILVKYLAKNFGTKTNAPPDGASTTSPAPAQ